MKADKARELWADVLADYQDAEMPNTSRDRAITFALYILAEEDEFYGSEITLLEFLQSEQGEHLELTKCANCEDCGAEIYPDYTRCESCEAKQGESINAEEDNPAVLPRLMDVARQCLTIYKQAAAADSDIFGGSLLDLLADNITRVSLVDLKTAIVASGIHALANDRIKAQIASYR